MTNHAKRASPFTGLPARGSVLVVDDEPRLRTIIAALLSDDHAVETAASAEEALERVRRGERFDAILSDIMLPGLSGMDLYDALVRDFPWCAHRVVFMTGGVRESLQRRIERAPNACLPKPIEVAPLRAIIAQTVARTQQDIQRRVLSAVRHHFKERDVQLEDDTRFEDDLGADSLSLVQFVLLLEERFGIDIAEDEASALRSVLDAVLLVELKLHAPLATSTQER